MEKLQCHDCQKLLEEGDEYVPYKIGNAGFVKCKICHKVDPVLRNYQETEVYSRVCGYIRPVTQWNKGKQQEFKDRAEFIPPVVFS